MSVEGIDEVSFGALDLAACQRFFGDWGLTQVSASAQTLVYESLNGCRVIAAASDKPGQSAITRPPLTPPPITSAAPAVP